MAGGGMQSNLNSQQVNPLAAAASAQSGGMAPTSNPFVRSGMAAMLMANKQPQMGGQAPMHRPMGPPTQMPQMPMQPPQAPFAGGIPQQGGMNPAQMNQLLQQMHLNANPGQMSPGLMGGGW